MASYLKSSISAPESAFGLESGSTNAAGSPVLPIRRGASRCGAGCAADSASVPRRITASRVGSVTRCSRRTMSSSWPRTPRYFASSWSLLHLLLLQRANHVAVVARREPLRLAHLARERVELIARCLIRDLRAVDQLMRVHLDAEILEIVGVDFRRQAVGLARARQHRGADPVGVFVNLAREGFEIAFPALEAALFKELANAVEKTIGILEVLLDLDDPGRREIRIVETLPGFGRGPVS